MIKNLITVALVVAGGDASRNHGWARFRTYPDSFTTGPSYGALLAENYGPYPPPDRATVMAHLLSSNQMPMNPMDNMMSENMMPETMMPDNGQGFLNTIQSIGQIATAATAFLPFLTGFEGSINRMNGYNTDVMRAASAFGDAFTDDVISRAARTRPPLNNMNFPSIERFEQRIPPYQFNNYQSQNFLRPRLPFIPQYRPESFGLPRNLQ